MRIVSCKCLSFFLCYTLKIKTYKTSTGAPMYLENRMIPGIIGNASAFDFLWREKKPFSLCIIEFICRRATA